MPITGMWIDFRLKYIFIESKNARILEISNSQPGHIISILTLVHRGELTCNGFSKVSTSKPNSFTHDATMNECDALESNSILDHRRDSKNIP